MNNDDIVKSIHQASYLDDVEKIKEGLSELNLRKKPGIFKDVFGKFKHLGQSAIDSINSNSENYFLFNRLMHACGEKGNIEFFRYLVESKELRVHININDLFVWKEAVRCNYIDMLKYMIGHPKVKNRAFLIVNALIYAADAPNNEVLNYLINDPNTSHYKEVNKLLKENHPKLLERNYVSMFRNLCEHNSKDGVKLLLEYDKNHELLNLEEFFSVMRLTCQLGHADLVKYMLTDPIMPYKPHVDYEPQVLLKDAAWKNCWEICKFLIIDIKIEQPKSLWDFLNPSDEIYKVDEKMENEVYQLFEQRKLYEGLSKDLNKDSDAPTSPNNSKRQKI